MTSSNFVGIKTGRSPGFSLENPPGVDAGLAIAFGETRTVAHQTASFAEFSKDHAEVSPIAKRRHFLIGITIAS